MPQSQDEPSPLRRRQEPHEPPPPAASRVQVTWTVPAIDGDAPSARGGHSAVLASEMLYIFGGHYFGSHGAFVYLNDLHRLDLRTSAWAEVVFPKKRAPWGRLEGLTAAAEDEQVVLPSPRYGHSAVLLNGGARMFVFGGRGDEQGEKLPSNSKTGEGASRRDMFFLDLDALAWFQVQWTTDCPRARFGHGCAAVDDARMAVFGGWDGAASMGDLWTFDSLTFTWQQPVCRGKPPPPRHNLSMQRLGGAGAAAATTLLVYGGYSVLPGQLPAYNKDVFLLDVESMTWSRPRLVGEYPTPTFGHGACLLEADAGGDGDEDEPFVLVLGGWSGTERAPLYMGDKSVRELVKMEAREQRLASGEAAAAQGGSAARRRWAEARARELQQSSAYARVLDVARMEWFRPRARGVETANRYGHSATRVGPHVFLFGGWDGNRALNQLVVGQVTTTAD